MAKEVTPTPADAIAQALADRTKAEKAIAAAELPLLQSAQELLMGPEVIALQQKLAPILAALGPSQSQSMLSNLVLFIGHARTTLPQDIARHQHTETL